MSSAELAIWARVDDLRPTDVPDALWQARGLVKSWAMRGTLHLIAARDYPLYIAAFRTFNHFRRSSWLKHHGVTIDELDAIIASVAATLDSSGMTREQLADAIVERTGNDHLRALLLSGWGALLKPAAFGGHLCFGSSQGQNVTFVRPDLWIAEWREIDSHVALLDVARRYLATYGPATAEDFGRWLGMDVPRARRLLLSLGDELVEVEVEGWKAYALASALGEMAQARIAPRAHLLPAFDPYTIALYRQPFVLDQQHAGRVSRAQGWISPVVLVGGRITGVWAHEKRRDHMRVNVSLFESLDGAVRDSIADEAVRLGAFLGGETVVAFES